MQPKRYFIPNCDALPRGMSYPDLIRQTIGCYLSELTVPWFTEPAKGGFTLCIGTRPEAQQPDKFNSLGKRRLDV